MNLGANVHVRDKNGNSLLHHIGALERPDACARLFLRHGVNPNSPNLEGKTPLDYPMDAQTEAVLREAGGEKTIAL